MTKLAFPPPPKLYNHPERPIPDAFRTVQWIVRKGEHKHKIVGEWA